MCAKRASKDLNFAIVAVPMESYLTSAGLDIAVETPVTTGLSDAGPRRVEGNYDWNESLEGAADFAAGASDATLFGMIGAGAAATHFDPTGGAVGPSDPHYDGSALLSAYSIKAATGAAITFSASLQGATAMTRAVA